jgi:hypothetical protein
MDITSARMAHEWRKQRSDQHECHGNRKGPRASRRASGGDIDPVMHAAASLPGRGVITC